MQEDVSMLKRVCIVAFLIVAAGLLVVFIPLLYDRRLLTEGETALLRSVYGSSVDLDRIRIKTNGPFTWTG